MKFLNLLFTNIRLSVLNILSILCVSAVVFSLAAPQTAQAQAALLTQPINYSNIWFVPEESGWGLHVGHHGDQIFAIWYTYDESGKQVFYVMSGGTFESPTLFKGDLFRTTGDPFGGRFNPRNTVSAKVGAGVLDFSTTGKLKFTATVNGKATVAKILTPFQFGLSGVQWPNDTTDVFFTPNESGWGLSIAQNGARCFAVVYHYNNSGQPQFLIASDIMGCDSGAIKGKLYRTASGGACANATGATWDPKCVTSSEVGEINLAATNATYPPTYQGTIKIDGATKITSVQRLQFGTPTIASTLVSGTQNAVGCKPLGFAADDSLTYKVINTAQSYTFQQIPESEQIFNDKSALPLLQRTANNLLFREYFNLEGNSLSFLGDLLTNTQSPGAYERNRYTPGIKIEFGLAPGQQQSVDSQAVYDNSASEQSIGQFKQTVVFEGREKVTVPAGTFEACRFLQYTESAGVTVFNRYWYAPGLWEVKRVNYGLNTGVIGEQVLTSAKVRGATYPK